jgi:hypothetical protein
MIGSGGRAVARLSHVLALLARATRSPRIVPRPFPLFPHALRSVRKLDTLPVRGPTSLRRPLFTP